jgi:CRP-like cAMP-binding protein
MEWALLNGLSDDERRDIMSRARRRKFTRRQVIFHEGDSGDAVHLVQKGHVGITQTTPLGDVALVRVVAPGEFFGELVLLSDGPRSATATAIEHAETLALHRSDFNELRRRNPAAQEALVEALAMEIRRLAGSLTEALFLPAESRLWRRLVALIDSYEPTDDGEAILPLTQEELGQLAGITRPTANRLLREAEAAGAIELRRGQLVVNTPSWIERRAR